MPKVKDELLTVSESKVENKEEETEDGYHNHLISNYGIVDCDAIEERRKGNLDSKERKKEVTKERKMERHDSDLEGILNDELQKDSFYTLEEMKIVYL